LTKIEVCQTCIKSKWGIGKPIRIEFLAPLNPLNPKEEIQYAHKHMDSDLNLLYREKGTEFCLKQCLKMGYYVSTIHGFEILRMSAEFFKDENGFIWFFYAHNIQGRKILNKKAMNSEDAKKEAKRVANNKEKMR
jgi:hypothetical protein